MRKDIKRGFIITYFYTSEESLNLLKKNIEILSKEDYYLVLATHSPLSIELQEMCDYYIYQSKNIIDNRKYSHGVAESNLIELAIKHLKDQGIDWTYKTTYDIEINDINRFNDWCVDGYDFVSCNWGDNIICTNSFFTKIDFLLENIIFFRTIDEMFSINTVLENCWEYLFRKRGVLDKIFSFKDKYEFYGKNKIDMLFYNYNDIDFWYSEEERKFFIRNSNEFIKNVPLKIFDYYTDLCIYNSDDFSLDKDVTFWLITPFSQLKSENGYYLEIYHNDMVIRKNILIKDFDLKHQFSKKFLTYKSENINFLFGYLNDFREIYKSLDLINIRNFVDLGANYGIASIPFMESGVKTYLVDADSRMIKLLKLNFEKNSNNKVIHQAIYSYDGVIDFFEDSDCSMVSSISEIDANSKLENRTKNIVSCITPNTLIEDYINEDYIDLIKIDIEGAEYDFFNTISDENLLKINKFLIEYHNNYDYKILEIIKKLTINNYKYKFMDDGYPIENKGGLIYAWK